MTIELMNSALAPFGLLPSWKLACHTGRTYGQYELSSSDHNAEVSQNYKDVAGPVIFQSERLGDKEEGQVEVGQTKECEEQFYRLVRELDVEEELSGP